MVRAATMPTIVNRMVEEALAMRRSTAITHSCLVSAEMK